MSNNDGKRSGNALNSFQYIVVIIVLVAVIACAVCFVVFNNKYSPSGNTQTEKKQTETEKKEETTKDMEYEETLPPETESKALDRNYTSVKLTAEDMHKGSAILVSSVYPYVFPEKDNLVSIYSNKSKTYVLSTTKHLLDKEALEALNNLMDDFANASNNTDCIIVDAYRTKEEQQEKYDNYVKKYGEKDAVGKVAKAGESDFQTGYTFDVKAYSDHTVKVINNDPDYVWLIENCHKYGFVERFPESKKEATGTDYEGGLCLRYVGISNAYIMHEKNLCLEEYVMQLNDYKFNGEHLSVTTADGKTFEAYSAKMEKGDQSIDVFVPADIPYSVSGNNVNGFIISYEVK